MKAAIFIKWTDIDGKWQEQRFFNVFAQAAFMKENPEIAKQLEYIPRKVKSDTQSGTIKKGRF